MINLTNATVIYAKGILFLFAGIAAAGLLVVQHPEITFVLLLATSIWCFCRFYYFAFYVITHYVDGSYRYSGLTSFLVHLVRKARAGR